MNRLRRGLPESSAFVRTATHVAHAERLLEQGRYEEAIAPLLEARRLAPGDAGVANDLGVAYMATRSFVDAVACFRQSIAAQPNVGSSHYNLGLALQHLGDDEGALAAHRRAARLSPSLTGAHIQLGDLLWERGSRAEAVAEYERTFAGAPGTADGYLGKIKALDATRRTREAARLAREWIALDPSSSLAHTLLGRLLQDAGRFEEAIASFERAVSLDPWRTDAHYGLVSSRKLTEADRPLIARIASRLEAGGGEPLGGPAVARRHRMMLHFAAGKAHDDLDEHAPAMHHFDAANAIRRALVPFDRRAIAGTADRLVSRFTPELMARHRALGSEDETPVLIVGLPRSGTTLLERILSSHPAVGGCGELDFWPEHGPAWSDARPERLAKAAARIQQGYLHALRELAPHAARATDKMPFNFLWVGLVHLLFPRARFVFSLRNPIDTCLSIYTTPLRASLGFASTFGDLAFYHRMHERILDHWRSVLPSDRWLDVHYEDVVADPEPAARRLVAFCGLPWDRACLRPDENPDDVRTASNWQARQPIYRSSVERWRRYEPWLTELRGSL